jgi:hypothetical protein
MAGIHCNNVAQPPKEGEKSKIKPTTGDSERMTQ